MSYSSNIDFDCFEIYSATNLVLQRLLEFGWSVDYHGSISYLPVGDEDDYDWQSAPTKSWPAILDLLQRKIVNKETVGLGLMWEGTSFGATFHFQPDDLLSVILNAERPFLPDVSAGAFADFTWYLSRIVPCLHKAGCEIRQIKCLDDVE